jgi:UDP-glucose 4-epimerase
MVTGGHGFIGGHVVDRLLEDGHEVLVFDRADHYENLVSGTEFFLGDIRDAEAVTEAMAHADGFIHLAGVLGTQETIDNPRPAAYTNLMGGLNVLEGAAQYGIPGVNIAVGNHWENNTYSITKSVMERFIDMFNKYRDQRFTVVRALNAYGPRQSVAAPYGSSKVRKIMPSFVCRAIKNDPIEVYADPELGSSIMDMIYVTDVADILVEALYYTMQNGVPDGIPEAGTGRRISVDEIAQAVINEVGQGQITHLPMRRGETPGAVVLGDPSTLNLVDYNPDRLTKLETGLVRTVQYFREYLDSTGY